MDEIFQALGLTVTAVCIEYSIDLLKKRQENKKKTISNKMTGLHPHSISQTIQTCAWRYADIPRSLLFDFSKTSTLRRMSDIKTVIMHNISPRHHMQLIEKSASEVELVVDESEKNESLVNQLMSILKHKGLYIKRENIWLKPTLTIARNLESQFIFWKVALFEFSIEDYDKEGEYKLKIRIIHLLNKTFKRLYNEQKLQQPEEESSSLLIEGDMIFIDINQIYFEKRQKEISAHLLVQEMKTKDNYVSIINPSRRFIYAPFLHRYLPIQFTLIQ